MKSICQEEQQGKIPVSELSAGKYRYAKVISIGLCGKNSSVNALTGMVPSSIGYLNNGGIHVESQMPTYHTNVTFTTRDIITVEIDESQTVVEFYKRDDSPEDFLNESAKGFFNVLEYDMPTDY